MENYDDENPTQLSKPTPQQGDDNPTVMASHQQSAPQQYDEPATQLSRSTTENDSKTRLSKKKQTGGRVWLWAAIGLLAAAAIGGAVYYFMNQEKSRPHADIDDEEDEVEMDDEDDFDNEDDDTYIMGRDHNDEEEELEEEEEEAVEERPVPPTRNADEPQELVLTGDADGYPLSLTLEVRADGHVAGIYKDESAGATIQVTGAKAGDAIRVEGRAGGTTYTLRIMPDGRLYTGSLNAGGASRELHLTERR